MAYNEFQIKRTALGKFSVAAADCSVTDAAFTVPVTGTVLPKGALVTGIRFFAAGALTNASNLKNATCNIAQGTVVLGTSNGIASAAIMQTSAGNLTPKGNCAYVPATGTLNMQFASSDSARTGVAFDADVYIEYLYCGDRDAS